MERAFGDRQFGIYSMTLVSTNRPRESYSAQESWRDAPTEMIFVTYSRVHTFILKTI